MFQKSGTTSVFRAFCLLCVTALPGVQRILLFFAVEYLFGLSLLGRFANDISIVFMVGFFTAVGWSSMIMIRVPQCEGPERLRTLFSMGRFALMWLVPAFAALFVLGKFGIVFDPLLSSAVLGAWSCFMLFRRFFLAIKSYTVLLAAELLLLVSIPSILWLFRQYPEKVSYLCFAVPCAAISLSGAVIALLKLFKTRVGIFNSQPGASLRGFEFGLNNFVSGGRTLLLTPLAVHLAGDAYGGLLGLINSVLGVVLLFPRTLSQYHLPDLSRLVMKGENESFKRHLEVFRKQVFVMLAVICTLASLGWYILGMTTYGSGILVEGAAGIFFVMLLALTVDQAVIVEANSLMVRELSSLMLKVNLGSSLFLLLLLLVPFVISAAPLRSMYLILAAYLISNILRSAWLVRRARSFQ